MLSISCSGRLLLFDRPRVMGIINATPDSFFAGSRADSLQAAVDRSGSMLEEGADVLDIGGQSTRPGSERVEAEVEAARAIPVVEAINKVFPEAILSIDTYYASVASDAVAAGASMVNDVSAGAFDPMLLPTVASLRVPYVLMHMQGMPQNMQGAPAYTDVVANVYDFLAHKLYELQQSGIHDVIIDPGFGFGKTSAHNFTLLKNLQYFTHLQAPLMVGLSRKGMVHRTLGVPPEESLNGTTVLHTLALAGGAQLLRVHDVREAMQAIELWQAYSEK